MKSGVQYEKQVFLTFVSRFNLIKQNKICRCSILPDSVRCTLQFVGSNHLCEQYPSDIVFGQTVSIHCFSCHGYIRCWSGFPPIPPALPLFDSRADLFEAGFPLFDPDFPQNEAISLEMRGARIKKVHRWNFLMQRGTF